MMIGALIDNFDAKIDKMIHSSIKFYVILHLKHRTKIIKEPKD